MSLVKAGYLISTTTNSLSMLDQILTIRLFFFMFVVMVGVIVQAKPLNSVACCDLNCEYLYLPLIYSPWDDH